MSLDIGFINGYGIEINNVEFDIDFLRQKYKNCMDELIKKDEWNKTTWRNFIDELEEAVENDGDWLDEVLYDIDHLIDVEYTTDDTYLVFNHKHIEKLFPETKLKDLDDVARQYAKEIGIKNVDDIRWIEFAYIF